MRGWLPLLVLSSAVLAGCSSTSNDSPSGSDASVADSGLFACPATLATACEDVVGGCPPPSTGDLPGPWCATETTAGTLSGSCGGYNVLTGTSEDGVLLFMYALDGGTLSGVLPSCIGALPGFALPTTCFAGGADLSSFTGPGAGPGCVESDGGATADGG
jgi:hypothetical protein